VARARDRSHLPDVPNDQVSVPLATGAASSAGGLALSETDKDFLSISADWSDDEVLSWLWEHRYFHAHAAMRQERFANLVARAQARGAQMVPDPGPRQLTFWDMGFEQGEVGDERERLIQ
jgi:hypothetical protein